jgi:hypothetical protein
VLPALTPFPQIRTRLAAPSKYVQSKTLAPLDFNKFVFDEVVMGALGLKDDMLPLAIITSNKHELVSISHETAR